MTWDERTAIAQARIQRAFEHKPIAVFGLFSGGHDSFCSAYMASLHPAFTGIVHINTGFGIEATRDYVRDTCARRNWPLLEYKASENVNARGVPDPQCYEDLVREFGFPGPVGHGMMYARLKERQLRRLQRDWGASAGRKERRHKKTGKVTPAVAARPVLYISGCRSQESDRRMANTDELQLDGARIWVAVIHDWSKLDTSEFMEHVGQPRNPVVNLIHKSGECLCGAYAKKGEIEELALWPETIPAFNRIRALEDEVVPRFGRGWGERPVKDNRTMALFPGHLCWSCDKGPRVP